MLRRSEVGLLRVLDVDEELPQLLKDFVAMRQATSNLRSNGPARASSGRQDRSRGRGRGRGLQPRQTDFGHRVPRGSLALRLETTTTPSSWPVY